MGWLTTEGKGAGRASNAPFAASTLAISLKYLGRVMLEFIGVIAVILFAWTVVKRMVNGAISATLLRARDYAQRNGVPREFALDVCGHPQVLKQSRQVLASNDREFRALDAYEQYGQAIVMLYAAELRQPGFAFGGGP